MTISFSSQLGPDDVRAAIEDMARMEPCSLRLWDFSAVQSSLSVQQLRGLALLGKSKSYPPSKVALVATQTVHYGLLRMYTVFRQDETSDHRVFRTVEEARSWLKE